MTMIDAMQAVENVMFNVLNSDVETLRDASRHILEAGGKRIRPRLLLLSYAALGGQDMEAVAPVAAAVELVHTASVVHDDINDHGVLRRGRPSVNAIWGRTLALLTGDYLFTKVYELMAPYKDLNILLAEATVALVEGETLQAAAAKSGNLSREIYYQIISRKTAALFSVSSRLGAKLASATEEQVIALGQYGHNVGLAFQIIDDVLDLIGDSTTLGKTAGIDISQGKGYAMTTHAVGNGSSTAVVEAVAVDIDAVDPMVAIKQKILQGNAIEEARMQAHILAQAALSSLDVLPPSPYKDQLVAIAHEVIAREF